MIEIGQISIDNNDVEYANNQIKLKINSGEYKKGSIFLTNQEIAFKNENSDEGFSIPWGKIVVTAISQSDVERSIYFMIDSKWHNENESETSNGNSNGNNHENEEDGDEDEGLEGDSEHEITEFWIVPDNSVDVDNIYFFMSKYPAAEEMEESDEDEEFFDGEDIEQMNINDEPNV